ncbi:hypothetical protein BJY01DRAFT_204144 [Aspergillus pseudoustus]|uniref:Uncharacterized protein n=1 Tax=Aspergillus pseudoustus TaxID=1810923 RepID=A0ABR4KT25_9EURO
MKKKKMALISAETISVQPPTLLACSSDDSNLIHDSMTVLHLSTRGSWAYYGSQCSIRQYAFVKRWSFDPSFHGFASD